METKKDRSALGRWYGGWFWKLDDGRELKIGEAIVAEGPGKGFAMYPWALDKYERVLGLRPAEAWLAKRLLKYKWSENAIVYPSMRLLSLEGCVSRVTLAKYLSSLQRLGYIHKVAERMGRTDHRVPYEIGGLLAALALCIAADPTSEWAKKNGGPVPIAEVMRKVHSWTDQNGQRRKQGFNLDIQALERLIARKDGAIEEYETVNKPSVAPPGKVCKRGFT